jgi:putative transposase
MPRSPRLFFTDIPYHVVQRGNNKVPIFLKDKDYLFFLEALREAKIEHPCFIYGYCLMTNHFHLLIEPKERNDNISLLIKLLGSRYVRYVNKNYNRSGTLWEGRFKCSLIDKESYFFTCLRYIEMNPVRAGVVRFPEFYRWSSYRIRAFGERSDILDLGPWYTSLDINAEGRQAKYRQFLRETIPESKLDLLREMTNKNGIVGSTVFKERIEQMAHKKIILRPIGRPRIKK